MANDQAFEAMICATLGAVVCGLAALFALGVGASLLGMLLGTMLGVVAHFRGWVPP